MHYPTPPEMIGEKYGVVKTLGSGSLALVYECKDLTANELRIAVKTLFPELVADKRHFACLRNDFSCLNKVTHPNVVKAYELIETESNIAFSMELADNGDLAEWLVKRRGTATLDEVANIFEQICLAVQAIHDAGLMHRNLKPENILLFNNNVVKVADFHIACGRNGEKLYEQVGVVGTVDYVSPEYMLTSEDDWRADIYALGILGYELLTDQSPFRGDTVYATMTKRLKGEITPPSALCTECTPTLDAIILRAMHRDPSQRYQSAVELINDFRNAVEQIESDARCKVLSTGDGTHTKTSIQSQDSLEALYRQYYRLECRAWILWLVGSLLAVLALEPLRAKLSPLVYWTTVACGIAYICFLSFWTIRPADSFRKYLENNIDAGCRARLRSQFDNSWASVKDMWLPVAVSVLFLLGLLALRS